MVNTNLLLLRVQVLLFLGSIEREKKGKGGGGGILTHWHCIFLVGPSLYNQKVALIPLLVCDSLSKACVNAHNWTWLWYAWQIFMVKRKNQRTKLCFACFVWNVQNPILLLTLFSAFTNLNLWFDNSLTHTYFPHFSRAS